MCVTKTGGGILQKILLDQEPGLSANSGHRILSGITLKQLLRLFQGILLSELCQ